IEVDLGAEGVQVLGLPFEFIHEARLILTDELIRESLRRAKLCGAAVDDTVTDVSEDPPAEDDDEPMPASTRH
ncbi:MAG: ribosome maturation factor RimP, partial [Pseudomonadota bacterium]